MLTAATQPVIAKVLVITQLSYMVQECCHQYALKQKRLLLYAASDTRALNLLRRFNGGMLIHNGVFCKRHFRMLGVVVNAHALKVRSCCFADRTHKLCVTSFISSRPICQTSLAPASTGGGCVNFCGNFFGCVLFRLRLPRHACELLGLTSRHQTPAGASFKQKHTRGRLTAFKAGLAEEPKAIFRCSLAALRVFITRSFGILPLDSLNTHSRRDSRLSSPTNALLMRWSRVQRFNKKHINSRPSHFSPLGRKRWRHGCIDVTEDILPPCLKMPTVLSIISQDAISPGISDRPGATSVLRNFAGASWVAVGAGGCLVVTATSALLDGFPGGTPHPTDSLAFRQVIVLKPTSDDSNEQVARSLSSSHGRSFISSVHWSNQCDNHVVLAAALDRSVLLYSPESTITNHWASSKFTIPLFHHK